MEVRLVLVGTAPAEQTQGGTLLHGLDRLAVEGLPTEIPSVIEVDVSGLDVIDATIYVHELSVPEEITVLSDPAQVVAKVAPPQVEKEPEEEVEEEVEGEVPEGEVPEGEEGAPEAEEGAETAAEDRKEGKR